MVEPLLRLPSLPGTYALVLRFSGRPETVVGRLGTLAAQPGFYVYVGSALGPGGLASRVGRHARAEKRCRWHIDYLAAVATLDEVWYTLDGTRRECQWAEALREIFIDGSFVEDKEHPNDIDGYFECELSRLTSGEIQRELNLLDPYKIWTWDPAARRPYRGYPKRQLPMWHVYRVELYPHFGQLCGIRDEHGHELEFPSAFRRSRTRGRPRGIVKIGGGP